MCMKVANRCKDVVKTEKQWNQLGFKLLPGKNGEKMWTNQFCQIISTYYRENEVEKMTVEEFAYWKDEDRKRKNQRARELYKIRAEEQKRLEEQLRQEELEREQKWQEWKDDCQKKIEELQQTKNLLAMVCIENDSLYIYEVPAGTEAGAKGIFPFGSLNEPKEGTVEWFVEPEKIAKEEWFPYRLKKVKEIIS